MADNVPVRIYIPRDHDMTTAAPVMFYYHGGGYCFGELGSYLYHLFSTRYNKKRFMSTFL